MVNWARRDFERELITGSLVGYVNGKTYGPRVEIRLSRGGHHQFISLCKLCQWAKLFPRQRMAEQSLKKHLKFHKRRIESDVPRHSKEPTMIASGKHRRRRSGAGMVETEERLEIESRPAPLGNPMEILADAQKESGQKEGSGDENNQPLTAILT